MLQRIGFVLRGLVAAAILSVATPAAAQTPLDVLHTFGASPAPTQPQALVAAADGNVYGVTCAGGSAGLGTFFRIRPGSPLEVLHEFAESDGTCPNSLIQGTDLNFYGTTLGNPAHNGGTVFRVVLPGVFTVLYTSPSMSVGNTRFSAGLSQLTHGRDGALYGTKRIHSGLTPPRALFRLTTEGVYSNLHTFDPFEQTSWVVQANDGNFYLTATGTMSNSSSSIVRVTEAGTASTLYTLPDPGFFSGNNFFSTGVRQASDGNLYALAAGQTARLLRVTLSGTVTTLHTFERGTEGGGASSLLLGLDGLLYGTFSAGGAADAGTAFKATLNGGITVLRAFTGSNGDGSSPSRFVGGSDGNLYGTATKSGADIVFRLRAPAMNIEQPSSSQSATESVTVSGWALDLASMTTDGVDGVHVYAFPTAGGPGTFLGAATFGTARPDVASVFGSQFANSGFALTSNALPPGHYTIVVFAHSSISGAFDYQRSVDVTVNPPTPNPVMWLDGPATGGTVSQAFSVSGWAIDRAAMSGTGVDAVHVWAFPTGGGPPVALVVTQTFQPRSDIGALYGSAFTNSGFTVQATGLSAGTYRVIAYARSTVSGTFNNAAFTDITVLAPSPAMTIDAPSAGTIVTQPFQLRGWAIDRGTVSGTGVDTVHVWAFPVDGGGPTFVGAAPYGTVRSDVGAVFGATFTNSGYSMSVSTLPPGAYDLVVYAHSSAAAAFNQWRTVRVTIQ